MPVDASTGLSASQKALDAVRTAPIWLLLALFLSTMMMWLVPDYLAQLHETSRSYLLLANFVLGIAAFCRIVAQFVDRAVARHARSVARDREKLTDLYRPLFVLFLTRHLTIANGVGSPLRHRWKNARAEIGSYERRSVGLKKAWHALFDSQSSTSAEIEFGGAFPMAEILKLVRKHSNHADVELLYHVARADRSRYEEAGSDFLTDEELALFQHIDRQHDKLSSR
jgi:hypothetical protein